MDLNYLKQSPYISSEIKMEKFDNPFNYIIIDNFFTDEIYSKLCEKFYQYISRVHKQNGKIGDSENFYEAFIYGLNNKDCVDGYDFFISEIWHNFISNIFKIELNEHIACTVHYHQGSSENPSKDGWPHTDLNIVSVIDHADKKIKATEGCHYPDDTFSAQPHTKKCIRSVACLYYFNNTSDLKDDSGGGTDIFKSYDKQTLIKEIKPINNRMFIFEISPKSYHGFHGAKFNRSAVVQWFHSTPSYILKRNLDLFKSERISKGAPFFEYWQTNNAWEADRDPEYSKYFDIPYSDLCKI